MNDAVVLVDPVDVGEVVQGQRQQVAMGDHHPDEFSRLRRHRVSFAFGCDETQARGRIFEDERELFGMELRVDRHSNQTGVPARKEQLDVLRAIRHEQGDPFTFDEPELMA
jgi:hypothetical protein